MSATVDIQGKPPTIHVGQYGPPTVTYAPERHYTDAERTCHIYNEMNTGNWWWSVQVCASHFWFQCQALIRNY
jgi:hypothetical protein